MKILCSENLTNRKIRLEILEISESAPTLRLEKIREIFVLDSRVEVGIEDVET